MLALPLDLVSRFELFLEGIWRGGGTWVRRRDSLAISLGLCGLRWEEVSRVQVKDIDDCGDLDVRSAKGGVRRTIGVGVGVVSALRILLIEGRCPRSDSAKVFFVRCSGKGMTYPQVRRRMTEWTKPIFGRAFSFHCLRHTAAVRVYRATRDVLAVQRFLGHDSLRWTETYLRSLERVEVGGLPAFCGGSAVGPKLFDPDGMLRREMAPPRPAPSVETPVIGREMAPPRPSPSVETPVFDRKTPALGSKVDRIIAPTRRFQPLNGGAAVAIAAAAKPGSLVAEFVAATGTGGVAAGVPVVASRAAADGGHRCMDNLVHGVRSLNGRVRCHCRICERFLGYADEAADRADVLARGGGGFEEFNSFR